MRTITTVAELTALIGKPTPRAAGKERTRLDAYDEQWLAHSPFCLMATSDADGTCDVSPKGDPPGFTLVLDDTTIALPERPGNRRADGFHNLLTNPHIGLIYLVPGRGDTLRINGRASLVTERALLERMVCQGHEPVLAVVVRIEQIFYHCSKAFLRSRLWQPESWDADALPSRARIAHRLERPEDSLEEIERYYGPGYATGLYAAPAAVTPDVNNR